MKQCRSRAVAKLCLVSCLTAVLTPSPVRADNVSRDHTKPYMFYIIIDQADFLRVRSQQSDDDFMQMHLLSWTPGNPYAHRTWDENDQEIAVAAAPGNVSPLYRMTPDSNPNCNRAWDKTCHLNFVKGFAVGWFQMNPGDTVHLDYTITNLSHENHDSAEKEFDQIASDVDTAIGWASDAAQLAGPDAQKVVSTVQDVVKVVTDIVNAVLDLLGDNKDTNCDGLVFVGGQDFSFNDLLNLNYTPRQQMSLAGPASTDPDRFPVVEGDLATIEDSGFGYSAPKACRGPAQTRLTIKVFKSVDPVGPPPPPPPLFGQNNQNNPTQLVPITGAPLHAWGGQWVDFPSVGYLNQARVQVQVNDVPAGSSSARGLLGPPIRRVASAGPAPSPEHSLEFEKARVRAFQDLVVKPLPLRAVLGGDPQQAASRKVSFQFSAADLARNNLDAMGVSMTERAPAPGLKVLDSYNANGFRPIAMRAIPFSGDVYWQSAFLNGSIGLSSSGQAARSIRETNPSATHIGSGLARGGIPLPARAPTAYIRHFAALLNPKPLADTVILPNGACLQLYGEYSAGTLFRYRVRYLRTEPNGSTTDVMLFPYMPPPR